jgi:hypothetical protein
MGSISKVGLQQFSRVRVAAALRDTSPIIALNEGLSNDVPSLNIFAQFKKHTVIQHHVIVGI